MAENEAEYTRKPIPKKQSEIEKSFVDPYSAESGDPNIGTEQNRGHEQSFRNDTVKPFSIGLEDIDESIMYYFNEVIKPFVIQNEQRIEVPLIYGSPERFKSAQKDGYYRDAKNKIMSPIIAIKRNTIDRVRNIGNKLDANHPLNFGIFQKKYEQRNAYSNFDVLTNRIPEKTYYPVIIPDYVNIKYNCTIQTYYVDQLNKIIEAINYASDSYWGRPEKFKFRATIDTFQTVNEIQEGGERVVKASFVLELYGYLVPDNVQKDTNAIKKFSDKSKIVFDIETVSDMSETEPRTGSVRSNKSTGFRPRTIDPGLSIITFNGGSGLVTINGGDNYDITVRNSSSLATVGAYSAPGIIDVDITQLNTASPIKTGQTTSYATGDDGDLEEGRLATFTTLDFNNVFGNTNRFTDELGGQTYTNGIIIDHSTWVKATGTMLGWRDSSTNNEDWATSITNAQSVSIGSFSSGWRIPNFHEICTVGFWGAGKGFGFSPFMLADPVRLWTSTTAPTSTTDAIRWVTPGIFSNRAKTDSVMNWIPCRTFTWNGSALT